MKNPLGLVSVRLARLKTGQSCLLGPYKQAASVTSKILNVRGLEGRKFAQRQVIVVDADRAYKFYLVTRVK